MGTFTLLKSFHRYFQDGNGRGWAFSQKDFLDLGAKTGATRLIKNVIVGIPYNIDSCSPDSNLKSQPCLLLANRIWRY